VECDLGVADWLPGLIEHNARDGGLRGKAEDEIVGWSLGCQNDGGRVLLMLLIGSAGISAGGGGEGPCTSRGKWDGEVTVVVRVDGVVRSREEAVRGTASAPEGS
jgi:hypothetical protein